MKATIAPGSIVRDTLREREGGVVREVQSFGRTNSLTRQREVSHILVDWPSGWESRYGIDAAREALIVTRPAMDIFGLWPEWAAE